MGRVRYFSLLQIHMLHPPPVTPKSPLLSWRHHLRHPRGVPIPILGSDSFGLESVGGWGLEPQFMEVWMVWEDDVPSPNWGGVDFLGSSLCVFRGV